jgi:hypothetical protein
MQSETSSVVRPAAARQPAQTLDTSAISLLPASSCRFHCLGFAWPRPGTAPQSLRPRPPHLGVLDIARGGRKRSAAHRKRRKGTVDARQRSRPVDLGACSTGPGSQYWQGHGVIVGPPPRAGGSIRRRIAVRSRTPSGPLNAVANSSTELEQATVGYPMLAGSGGTTITRTTCGRLVP